MAANTSPIALLTPLVGFATILTANTATDGTGTVATLITMGGAGGRLDRIRLVPLGTNIASKVNIFLNNGATQATAANNALILEIPLLSSTASNLVQAAAPLDFLLGLVLPAAFVVNATIATTVATGWKVIAFGGSY